MANINLIQAITTFGTMSIPMLATYFLAALNKKRFHECSTPPIILFFSLSAINLLMSIPINGAPLQNVFNPLLELFLQYGEWGNVIFWLLINSAILSGLIVLLQDKLQPKFTTEQLLKGILGALAIMMIASNLLPIQ